MKRAFEMKLWKNIFLCLYLDAKVNSRMLVIINVLISFVWNFFCYIPRAQLGMNAFHLKKASKDTSEQERRLDKPLHPPPDFFLQKVALESLSDGPFPSSSGPWPLPAHSGFGICKIFHHLGMTKVAKTDGCVIRAQVVWWEMNETNAFASWSIILRLFSWLLCFKL